MKNRTGKIIGIVEDDELLCEAVSQMLLRAGYEVRRAGTVREAKHLMEGQPDLLLVDAGLPDGDGTELCQLAHKKWKIPVIFLTARDEEERVMQAFDIGADDYLVKPVSFNILLKHMEAVLRRSENQGRKMFYNELMIDFDRMQVCFGNQMISLTQKEYQLLELLAENRGRVVTKKMMLEQIWDVNGAYVEENTVNVTLNRLRRKIEPDPQHPVFIRNVFGLGYTFGA